MAPLTRDRRPTILLATASGVGERDEDAPRLLAALDHAGAHARTAVWDDPLEDWSSADLVVVRSTWDYTTRLAEFLEWARDVAAVTRLANPPRTLEWNTDKRYLAELAAAGVPVVPTTYLPPDADADEIAAAVDLDGDVVVKPTVSAGARDTARHGRDELAAARRHVEALLDAGRHAMVQPYLVDVERRGETGIVVVDGGFVHAFSKAALLVDGPARVEGLWAPERIAATHPEPDELEVAEQAVRVASALTGSVPLYARVDLVRDDEGRPVLLELELTEPSLFLGVQAAAAVRVAAAMTAQAAASARSR